MRVVQWGLCRIIQGLMGNEQENANNCTMLVFPKFVIIRLMRDLHVKFLSQSGSLCTFPPILGKVI